MTNEFGLADSNTFSKKKFLNLLKRPEASDTFEQLVVDDFVLEHLKEKVKHKFHYSTQMLINMYYPQMKTLILSKEPNKKFKWWTGDHYNLILLILYY